MKNTLKLIDFHETCGDKFFTVAITNQENETHTITLAGISLIEVVRKGKIKFEVAENDDLIHELNELAFIEIAVECDDETEKEIYDIYKHKFYADEDGIEYDEAGEYLKTFKTLKGANNFAAKQGYPVI